jgi:hypothetical protein
MIALTRSRNPSAFMIFSTVENSGGAMLVMPFARAMSPQRRRHERGITLLQGRFEVGCHVLVGLEMLRRVPRSCLDLCHSRVRTPVSVYCNS